MEALHPLAADADAPPEELALAQAECALTLGRLDGLLAGLTESEERLFCAGLLRAVLLSALAQAGFADAELRFNAWFAGIGRAPQETHLTPCSAYAVVRALLGELGHHPWEPLAETARTIAAAARFGAERQDAAEDAFTGEAIIAAIALVRRTVGAGDGPLPFPALARLNALLCQDPLFAPVERGLRTFSLGGRDVTIEQTAPRTPLWAVDAALGLLLALAGTWRHALPCPGAVTVEALQPHLWPAERAILVARSLHASVIRLSGLVADARARAALMREHLGHLRSSARAPQVWILLAGFAPLGLDQMASACGVSRRGTYAIGAALTAAGLARRTILKGKVLWVAEERPVAAAMRETGLPAAAPASPAFGAALGAFDAAMAEIDNLLARGRT
ncbi:MAG: hypothetical protein KME20_22040 [Kaiparowitsia implicata GSE-PSE-MK54-09C]|jgi:hypothetical protein|nr:hypothetical protein [Kaiparowitsia implicata GSE-PSE-MK54-09C]